MQIPRRLSSILAIVLIVGPLGRAEGPSRKLPQPGGWARYHATTKNDDGVEFIGRMTLKSVSETTVDGAPCRWLETEYVAAEGKHHERRKILFPDRAIESSEHPLEDALKYLQQDDETAVASIPPEEEGWMPTDLLYFPGFLKAALVVDDPRIVKYQGGMLDIAQAYVGTYKWQRKDKPPGETTIYETQYRVWLHADLLAGFAHAKMSLNLIARDKTRRSWQCEYALQEFGNDARPAIREESAPPIKR